MSHKALKKVPRAGFNVQGTLVRKTGRIIDVNKALGTDKTDFVWNEPETGTKPILDEGYDITDPNPTSSQGSSLDKGAVLAKPSMAKNAELPNEALADGEKRSEHQLTEEEKKKLAETQAAASSSSSSAQDSGSASGSG